MPPAFTKVWYGSYLDIWKRMNTLKRFFRTTRVFCFKFQNVIGLDKGRGFHHLDHLQFSLATKLIECLARRHLERL
ncbi:hypothetical protein BpHYR1_014470 [Brachionus plicatilis]|uniref:Uncharacterized protein n=1 Tax=Brachionus plicatilis TaxID=10195 RepID=A0A3M7PYB1_BRAPC|nr:hypothetical protein BpHYR1_014470 [Brachionus plicatilis]